MMKGKWLVVILCLCMVLSSFAQTEPFDSSTYDVDAPVVDTSVISSFSNEDEETEQFETDTLLSSFVQFFPKDSIYLLRNTKPLDRINNLDSLLQEWQKQYQKKQPKQSAKQPLAFSIVNIFRFLLWVFVIGAVLFLIYRLFLSERSLFSAPKRNQKIQTTEEEITDTDVLAQKIKDAEKSGNYRVAVRYHYLQALSILANKNWLQLSPDKTNYQYLRELGSNHIRNDFARITLHYEYAWYGNFEIDQPMYDHIQSAFKLFHKNLKN